MPRATLLDIAVRNGADALAGLIEEAIVVAPELQVGEARTISTTNYRTYIRTELPPAGFRHANQGVDAQKSTFENRLVETFILNVRFEVDRAVADRYEDGSAAYLAIEAAGQMQSAFRALSRQFYYGRGQFGDAAGFPGLIESVTSAMTVSVGGTTANACSSVWAVRWGMQDVIWVWGDGGRLELSDVRTETLLDANSKPFTGYVQELLAYPGLQVGRSFSVGRIRQLTEEAGRTLTDQHIATLISKFPAGMPPQALFMSRRSLAQLRQSRTATNPTGAPAPFPTESFGIPIYVTDAILDTEPTTL